MDEDIDQVAPLELTRERTFSPSRRPTLPPWTRSDTSTTGFQRTSWDTLPRTGSDSLQRMATEPNLRRKRSRQLSQTSVDTSSILLDKRERMNTNPSLVENEGEEGQQWHSIALLFVALPAAAGMFFENGSAIVTDMLMLGLGCLFLYWSVKWPWQWYYSTQELKLSNLDSNTESILDDEDEEDELETTEHSKENGVDGDEKPTKSPESFGSKNDAHRENPVQKRRKRAEAASALQSLELMALSSCFLSPAAVAYVLHSIRPYLSRPSGGLVSNSNLTLFVLAAELRPILHFFRLVEERTLHLQRIVSALPPSEEKVLEDRLEALNRRLDEMDKNPASTSSGLTNGHGMMNGNGLTNGFSSSHGSGTASSEPTEKNANPIAATSDVERTLRLTFQPQLDALNRAVRRYEKRATTQAIVTEARLKDLEARLKDALSLAAAASRNSERSGLFGTASGVAKFTLLRPLEALQHIALLPFELAGEAWRFLMGPRRRKKSAPSEKFTNSLKGKQRLEAR